LIVLGCRVPAALILVAGLLVAGSLPKVQAAESVRILAAGAAQAAVMQLQPDIASITQAKVEPLFDTVGALRDRVLAGEAADLVILSEAGIAALEKAGRVAAGTAVDLGSISVALAVRKGARVPDVGSPDSLKQTLLDAGSIAHADPARGATAGTHFARVLERLGIAEQVKPRLTILGFGGDVIVGVAQGRFEIGVSQSSEIVAHPGVTLVGALPPPYAHRTRYLAAKPIGAGAQADALLTFMRTPAVRSVFARFGFAAAP
jgi:molybdate transport system substrate-binding protein